MNKAILGKKLGMSQIFTADGTMIPVTVVEAGPCCVVQVKTADKDGYDAVKVGFGSVKEKNVNKPTAGQYKQAGVAPRKYMREFRFADCSSYAVGGEIKCDVFAAGDHVDVVGTSKGRGYTGTIQRWNTHCGPKAHGSGYHRGVGSLSANSSPSRVFKNKKMPGQYGHERVTVQNLEVVKVDAARNIILIAGGIPGPKDSLVIVKESLKKSRGSKWFK
ncbi:MAG: 50S ribosomal protein L3 [Firmicutes bacterium]|uniref:Large ribosomal subunit protein uL3 n=1 Tax=Candidatus Stercoripulliclostridium pullicola TaxID=2840953 RepID=A0A940ID67_9FIRM|nr:50S ribosomal protein L3 [Candidatus Stercoripulliclostridium pullicola]